MSKVENTDKILTSIGKAKLYVKRIIDSGGFNQSIYFEGPSGIGKSEIVQQIADENNSILVDLRLGNLDVIDLNGIGIPDIEKKQALFTRPEFFPPEDCDKKYILFLDEFNHASEAVFGAAYQIVLERRMGTHILPKNVLIIAAGNSVDDKGISFTLPSPLVNRFMKMNVIPSIEDWLDFAQTSKIDWRILGFLKANPEYLHKFDPKSNEDNFPTPRNWVKLNSFIKESDDKEFFKMILNSMFGFTTMVQFETYLSLVGKIPHIEEIISGNFKTKLDTDLNSSYAFYMLVRNYVINNLDKMTNEMFSNIFRFNNLQSNQEIMQLLNIEIMTIINKNMERERRDKLQFEIFHNNPDLEQNKNFKNKMMNFNKSMVSSY